MSMGRRLRRQDNDMIEQNHNRHRNGIWRHPASHTWCRRPQPVHAEAVASPSHSHPLALFQHHPLQPSITCHLPRQRQNRLQISTPAQPGQSQREAIESKPVTAQLSPVLVSLLLQSSYPATHAQEMDIGGNCNKSPNISEAKQSAPVYVASLSAEVNRYNGSFFCSVAGKQIVRHCSTLIL